jgi:hypothetical protein
LKQGALLALGVIFYAIAAWMVAPGFYDGFNPSPYAFTCPPPQAGDTKPTSGHVDIRVVGGVSEANSAFTNDGQLVIGFLPGAFIAGGKTSISVDIKPLDTCPNPTGIRFVTNIYQVTADAMLDPSKPANLVLQFSNLVPNPSTVYQASDPNGQWSTLPSQPGQPFTIASRITTFGYFAGGYPATSPPPGSFTIGGGQILPIVVAMLIVVVVLVGLPLAVIPRRR